MPTWTTLVNQVSYFPSTKYEGRSLFHFSSSLWFQKSLDNKSNIKITGKAFTELNEIFLRQCTDKAQIKIVVQSLSNNNLSGLHTANLSKQTRVGKHRKVDNLFPSHASDSCQISNTVICNMAVFLSVVALTYNSETEEKKRRNRKRWRNRKVWTKPSLSAKKLARIEASPICCQQFANLFAACFCASLTYQLEFANTSLPTLVCRVKSALGLLLEEERRHYWVPLFHILIFK